MSQDSSMPPRTTIVVHTPDGPRELLLHPNMETTREDGILHIVHGERTIPIPPEYKPYETYGKVFHMEDGNLCRLSKVQGIDDHPDDITKIVKPVPTTSTSFLGLELLEIQREPQR